MYIWICNLENSIKILKIMAAYVKKLFKDFYLFRN